jgi:hypothetical protein
MRIRIHFLSVFPRNFSFAFKTRLYHCCFFIRVGFLVITIVKEFINADDIRLKCHIFQNGISDLDL